MSFQYEQRNRPYLVGFLCLRLKEGLKMMLLNILQGKLRGLYDAISRYPLTIVFLIAAAVVNAMAINREVDYFKFFLTYAVGASLGFTLQAAWERYYEKISTRALLMGVGLLLTLGYFLIVRRYTTTSIETSIRTSVALFALAMAYIWVPVIKSKVSFNESFMTAFKSFFNSLLFSGVLFLGVSLIITATDLLLFRVDEKVYAHSANLIMVLFAPIYFLSLIPIYPGVSDGSLPSERLEERDERIAKSSSCPKFLEILISYIIIPLLSMYTVILVIYIATNITGKFWTDNRLEPMFVGYAITVILIYILASRLGNKFAALFRKIFPKILVPIVLFQIVSSVIRTMDTGIMHGRYYVILFGIFAAITGILLSFLPVRKNGIVAALLIVFSVISIVPPVDAFTISRSNQLGMLESTLVKNNMLKENKVIPNPAVPEADRKVISDTINYLGMMEYTKDIAYLGEDFNSYDDFYDTFGFYRYEETLYGQEAVNLNLNPQSPINISGYDRLVTVGTYYEKGSPDTITKICDFEKAGVTYTLSRTGTPDPGKIWLSDDKGQELITVDLKTVFDKFDTSAGGNYRISKDSMPAEEATYTQENDRVLISLVALNLYIDKSNIEQQYGGDFYVLMKIK